jgi:hypothetical protein
MGFEERESTPIGGVTRDESRQTPIAAKLQIVTTMIKCDFFIWVDWLERNLNFPAIDDTRVSHPLFLSDSNKSIGYYVETDRYDQLSHGQNDTSLSNLQFQ